MIDNELRFRGLTENVLVTLNSHCMAKEFGTRQKRHGTRQEIGLEMCSWTRPRRTAYSALRNLEFVQIAMGKPLKDFKQRRDVIIYAV